LGLLGLWGFNVAELVVRGFLACRIAGSGACKAPAGRFGGVFFGVETGLSGCFVGARVP